MRRDLDAHPGWVFTFTGEPFWPLEPRVEDVRIADIAHGLSHLCRFAGQTRKFYSVAQHSVLVSRHLPRHLALYGLLHDGSEAYLVDITVPVKVDRALAGYRAIEAHVQRVIYERFALDPSEPSEVHRVDRVVAETEIRDLVVAPQGSSRPGVDRLRSRIAPIGPVQAKRQFLNRFCELTGQSLPDIASGDAR